MNSDLNNLNKQNLDADICHDTMNPLKDREEDKYLHEKSLYNKDCCADELFEGGKKKTGLELEHNRDLSQKDHLKHQANGIAGGNANLPSNNDAFFKN